MSGRCGMNSLSSLIFALGRATNFGFILMYAVGALARKGDCRALYNMHAITIITFEIWSMQKISDFSIK